MKKTQMFMPIGKITVAGNAKAVESLAAAVNKNQAKSILILQMPELDEAGLPFEGADVPMELATVEVQELEDGQAVASFAFQGTKLQTEYCFNASLDPANWWHPRNDETDWFWVFTQHRLVAGDDYTISLDWLCPIPEEELIPGADDNYEI